MSQADELTKSQDPKVRYVISKFIQSRDYYASMRRKFTDWDELFLSKPKPKAEAFMSNLFIPLTHKAVMTLVARVMNNCFSVDPNFDVVPSNKKISNLMRAQLWGGNFYTRFFLFCLQLLIRGTSIGKITWDKRKKTRFTLEKETENIMKQMEDLQGMPLQDESGQPIMEKIGEKIKGFKKSRPIDDVAYDGPSFETVDLFDFFPEPNAVDLNSGCKIMRSVKPKHEVIANTNFKNTDLIELSDFPDDSEFPHSRLKDIGLTIPGYEPNEELKGKEKKQSEYCELLECETKWYNKETGKFEKWLITVGNRKVLLVDEPTPYWNLETMYVRATWLPILNEFYGIGIAELSECIQEEYNDKRNQRTDNLNQILQPIYEYEEGSVDPRVLARFKRKPGAKLRMLPGGINATRWDVAPDVTSRAMEECMKLENDLEEVTGAVKAVQSTSNAQDIHRTSSGIMLMQSMANEKIKLNLSLLERMALEPIFDAYFELNLQYLSPGYMIFNPEGQVEEYSPKDLIGEYIFKAKGSRYALDQQMKLMNITRAIEALGMSGLPVGELHVKFWLRLYDALGFEDKDEVEGIIRSEIQKQQKMQEMMAQAKAQGGGGGGIGGPENQGQMTDAAMGVNDIRSMAGQQIPGGQ